MNKTETRATGVTQVATLLSLAPSCVARDVEGVRYIQDNCHTLACASGWWKEYFEMPQKYQKHFIAGKIALVHSEVSEALEAYRKNLMDYHLPHRPGIEVEFADAIIRMFDIAGALQLDIAGALIEKLAYNQKRPDHKLEAREVEGGKSF